MKTYVYYNNKDIRLEERPVPSIQEGEILIKMRASGICGTDIMEWYRIKKGPRVLGHEVTGEVIESKSRKFSKGDRVFVSHHVPCDECIYCEKGNHTACETLHKGNFDPGGFSEYIRIPKINVEKGTYKLAPDMSYEEGTMIEPLACVIRGQRILEIKKGDKVLVLGSGISGLLHIQLAKLKGAHVIATDINDFRLKKAKEFGADEIYKATDQFTLTAQKVIVSTGAKSAVKQAFDYIDRKGSILMFAVPQEQFEVPSTEFWRNEISLLSTYGAAPIDLSESISIIKKFKNMITHQLDLEEIQKGFDLFCSGKECLKVVLTNNR